MAVDKKITQLNIANELLGNDAGVIARDGSDYQFQLSTLLSYIESGIQTGAAITFGTVLPQNTTGKNGDLFINIAENSFAQKTADVWTTKYQITSNGSGNTIIYNTVSPIDSIGSNGDTFINTTTGAFYKKADGNWQQVFSMLNGPAGPRGPKGDTGSAGADGKSVLSGTTDPSNLSTGTDGDFYINTNTNSLFGPKTNGIWGSGVIIGGASSFAELDGDPSGNMLLAAALNAKFDTANLYDNIDSTSITKALTANQGNKLQTQITNLSNALIPHPTYYQPSADITTSNSGPWEIGFPLTATITLGFTKNDAGNYNTWAIRKNGTTVTNGTNTGLPKTYTDSIVISGTSPSYQGSVTYDQGAEKNNVLGTPDANGQIAAGTKFSAILNGFGGYYNFFFGPCAAIPASSSEVRALSKQLTYWGNSFTLNTQNSQLYLAIAIPPGRTLSSVIDLDALNAVITSEYQDKGTITVNDYGGNPVSGYKLYVKTLGVAYSSNHRHQITIL